MLLQASSTYSLKVQGWLREDALEWGSKIDTDIGAKEKHTETVKQERQRDTMKLKVCPSPRTRKLSSTLMCGDAAYGRNWLYWEPLSQMLKS